MLKFIILAVILFFGSLMLISKGAGEITFNVTYPSKKVIRSSVEGRVRLMFSICNKKKFLK